MEIIKNKRVFALAGIILLVLGTWLPYYEVNVIGIVSRVSAWGYWEGKIILLITLANALFIFKDFIEKYVPQLFQTNVGKMVEKANAKASLIPTILIVAFLVYMYIRLNARANEFITNGLGFYALWLGAICLVVHAFVYKPTTANIVAPEPQPVENPNQTNPFATQITSNNLNQEGNTQNPSGTPGKKYCPKCGNQVDESASFCFMCGNKF